MRRLARGGVVDASVAVKLVLTDELLVDAALEVLRVAGRNASAWPLPDLFDIECSNVVRKAVVRSRLHLDQAEDALAILLELPQRRVESAVLAGAALAVALRWSVSVYDACYMALATMLAVPLVTADRRLASALEPSGHEVIFLGDVLM